MALSETPDNPFAGDDQANNIKAEKVEVLRMLAEHGTKGYEIYDEARTALQSHEEAVAGKIDSGRYAPTALLKSIAGRHTQSLRTAIEAVKNLRAAEGDYFGSLSSSTGTFMDSAAADRSGDALFQENLQTFLSRGRELDSETRPYDLRARPHEYYPSRSGRGGGGGGGFSSGPTTVPLGLLSEFTGADLASRGRGLIRGPAITAALNRARSGTRRSVVTPARSTRSTGGGGQRSLGKSAGSASRPLPKAGFYY